MKFFILIILIIAICSKSLESSQEANQGTASAEFNSNELKPLSERKVLNPPSPAFNRDYVETVDTELETEYNDRIHPLSWDSPDEERMDVPILSIEKSPEKLGGYGKSYVDEWGLRRTFRNERRKNKALNEMVDKKHEKLSLHNANKNNEILQYTKSLDDKVDALHADHQMTRKLAKSTRNGYGAIRTAMNKHKTDTDDRLKRHSGELKLHGTRLETIQESVNEKHQETADNMEAVVKQLGKNVIQENNARQKIGQVLEQHGKHLDKARNKLKNMKARTKHLYDSVEVQGGALDELGTNFGDITDEVKALKQIVSLQGIELKKLQASHGQDEAVKKMVEHQQMLTKSTLESNKQVLQLLDDFAHQLDAKVSTAMGEVDLQLAKILSNNGGSTNQQQPQQQQQQPPQQPQEQKTTTTAATNENPVSSSDTKTDNPKSPSASTPNAPKSPKPSGQTSPKSAGPNSPKSPKSSGQEATKSDAPNSPKAGAPISPKSSPKSAAPNSPKSPKSASSNTINVVNPNVSGGEQQQKSKAAKFSERVQHPLFLKKRDPKREQYEKEQQQKQQASPSGSNPAKVEERLGRSYADELSKAPSTASSSSSTTDESNITFESALKALGLKKNGKKLMANTETAQTATPEANNTPK